MITFLKELNLKKINRKQLVVVFLVGVLLVVISIPTSENESTDERVEEELQVIEVSEEEYQDKMERKLEEILAEVEGVGDVKVMITLEGSSELIVEKDQTIEENEIKEETIYEDNSDGQTPYVKQEYYPTVEGVVVIASGGDSSVVIANITEAIQALFDVDTHKIKIMKMIINE